MTHSLKTLKKCFSQKSLMSNFMDSYAVAVFPKFSPSIVIPGLNICFSILVHLVC